MQLPISNKMKHPLLLGGLLVFLLVLAGLLSVMTGARFIPPVSVLEWICGRNISTLEAAVLAARLPRTVFGLLAGASLGLSGTILQALTRNPVADPGTLGVNAGAGLFVCLGTVLFSLSDPSVSIWLALAGGCLASLLVYVLASAGWGGATPVKLALAGAAVSLALVSLTNAVLLPDAQAMDQFRFWQAGSLGAASWPGIVTVVPYLLAGMAGALFLGRWLNILALGDAMATGLGVHPEMVRMAGAFFAVLLASSVTALCGPIAFVGLMVPHLVKGLAGADYRLVLPFAALAGADLLVLCDVLGRILGGAGELETGIVTALVGAPFFIAVVRQGRGAGL